MPDGFLPIAVVDEELRYINPDGVELAVGTDMKYFIGYGDKYAYGKLHPLELPMVNLEAYLSGHIVVELTYRKFYLSKDGWRYEAV